MKIVSPQILHKTEAGGVLVGVKSAEQATEAYADHRRATPRKYDAKAEILGVQVQQMLAGGQEVIIGAVTDPAFGKLVAFGLGGILVEVLKDITFRLAPATHEDALSMLDGIAAAEILRGVRGAKPVDRAALAGDDRERVARWSRTFPKSRRWISIRCSPPSTARPRPTCASCSTSIPRRAALSPEPGRHRARR